MTYSRLRNAALALLVVLFILLSNYLKEEEEPLPVMAQDDTAITVQSLSKSLYLIGTIEYKQFIKAGTSGDNREATEVHYYFKKPGNLRVETKGKGTVTIDIYTPKGMYEYFPLSNIAYYRERWDDGTPISFQLNDKLDDIKIRGKYEFFKTDRVNDMDCEILRSVDDDGISIYEHKIWLANINNMMLPVKEEYLTDGEVNMTYMYQYISINREIPSSLFELKSSDSLDIHRAEGIPKLVKNEEEAEKYVKFNVTVPKYVPQDFSFHEMFIIPPVKTPSVLITYIKDDDTIYCRQTNTGINELQTIDGERIIKSSGMKFAIRDSDNDSLTVRWVKNGILYEVNSPEDYTEEMIKMIQSISGQWINIED